MRLLTLTCAALFITTALQAHQMRPTPRPDHLVADVRPAGCTGATLECQTAPAK